MMKEIKVTLSEEASDDLIYIKGLGKFKDIAHLVREAISLLKFLLEKKNEGYRVILKHKQKKDLELIGRYAFDE